MSRPPDQPAPRPPSQSPAAAQLSAAVAAAGGIPLPRFPEVTLGCNTCQHLWQPSFEDWESGRTGCPRCGGWTFLVSVGPATPSGPAHPAS
jgi:hypothetical protein